MSAPQNFRTAFNGFNREDVVRYLEYINNKHNAQVNQLSEENAALRAQLEAAPAAEDRTEEVEALTEQLNEALARCAELEKQLGQVLEFARKLIPRPRRKSLFSPLVRLRSWRPIAGQSASSGKPRSVLNWFTSRPTAC